ncbi:MAG: hypothetical protein QE285_17000 [Aquabacterium sp.]|nr:hypothetical protein [Aquabacterium sp.]
MIDKRGFLLGAASAVAAPQVLAAAATRRAHAPLDMAGWQALLAQPFALSDGQRHWTATLQSVQPLPQATGVPQGARTEQFTLAFRCADGQVPAGGLHRLQAADGRSMLVQLDPAGSADAPLLRAEFNLLRA